MPTTLIDLGKRIRAERLKRQLTLEKFSNKTGLSKSFLSQIERGNTEPSITSLKKIAAEFGYSVVNLFPNGSETESNWGYPESITARPVTKTVYRNEVSVVRADMRKRLALPGSNVVYDLLTPDMRRQLEVMYMKVKAGANSGNEPMLDSPGEKMCFVVKGKLEVTVGKDVYQLAEGDTINYPAHVEHSWRALEGETIEVIWILTPPSF
jgi:transcriptional regulator with XRE-family HTH domain